MLKLLEFLVELLGAFRIIASPLLVSLGIGALIYVPEPSPSRLVIATAVVLLGLTVGIIWAIRVWRKSGTISFLARIIATPELDKTPENQKTLH